jgi:hypothetical protein
MARELAVLQAMVTSTTESVLGCLPDKTFQVEVVGELVAEFRRLEELCSLLEWLVTRIYNLLLRPLLGRARWADHLDKATRQLRAELATRWEAVAELEALWTSAA